MAMGLYVDANNYAFIESRGTGGSKVRLVVVQGGVSKYDYTTSVNISSSSWNIIYDIDTKEILFYSDSVQQGTTQAYDLGSTVYVMVTCADSATYADLDSFVLYRMSLLNIP
jgi:hypothetical protein